MQNGIRKENSVGKETNSHADAKREKFPCASIKDCSFLTWSVWDWSSCRIFWQDTQSVQADVLSSWEPCSAALYGGLLLACMRGGVRDRSWLYLPYGIYLLFVGAFGLYLLADLVHTFLLSEESFLLLTVLILLLVLYSRRAGLEGRGRTFEVLFWPMLLLLIILLALGASSLRGMNLFPLQFSKKGFAFLGWYPLFWSFPPASLSFLWGMVWKTAWIRKPSGKEPVR